MYVESACSAAFNRALKGYDEDGAAGVYNFPDAYSVPVPYENRILKFSPDVRKDNQDANTDTEYMYFISVTTPLALFLLAVCLKLPHVIWMLFSGSAAINIDQTLETAKSGQNLNKDSRYKLRDDLIVAVTHSAKSSSFSTSLLYMLFKILMCVVPISGLILVNKCFLPQAHSLQNTNETTEIAVQDYINRPFLCDAAIRVMSNVQRYTVQCVFTPSISADFAAMMSQSQKATAFHPSLYEALYTILLAFFAVLVIINVINLLMWVIKLMLTYCRQRFNTSNNLPLDIYLLLYMAQENAGPLVTKDLAEGFAWLNKKEKKDGDDEREEL